MTKSYDDRKYEVGYGKPPQATRWKPGQSGNPKGRPKKIKDFDKLLDRELSETLRITDNGETRTLTKRELLLKRLVNDALTGNRAALKLVLSFMKAELTVNGFEPDAADREALMCLFEKAKLEDENTAPEQTEERRDG